MSHAKITPKELQEAYEKVNAGQAVLLDVRAQWEREEEGYEPKAMHMDYELFTEGKLPDLPKDATIYVHCKAGGRAGVVAQVMQVHGFKQVFNLGGYKDWCSRTGAA